MKLLIDSAVRVDVQAALGSGIVAGATTNPTLLRRAGLRAAEVPTLARQFLDWGAGELHLQVYAADTAGMLADAAALITRPGAC